MDLMYVLDYSLPSQIKVQYKKFVKRVIAVGSEDVIQTRSEDCKRLWKVLAGMIRSSHLDGLLRPPINHNNCIYRKSAVECDGSYTNGPMQDFRLWVTMLKFGYSFYELSVVPLLAAAAQDLDAKAKCYIYFGLKLFFKTARRCCNFGVVILVLRLLLNRFLTERIRNKIFRRNLRNEIC